MGSENLMWDKITEFDDSGCVQDESSQNGILQTSLIDMPDDVLFYILQCLNARDLKALGYCCRRLCRLVQEKALWRHVDATQDKCSRARLKWLLDNVLHTDTQVLLLSGYAKDVYGCAGFMHLIRSDGEKEKGLDAGLGHMEHLALQLSSVKNIADGIKRFPPTTDYWFRRCSGLPTWGDPDTGRGGPGTCVGPQFSLSKELLKSLRTTCPKLHTLALDYCNIDCGKTTLGQFPKTLKTLSLRGTKCYNMAMDKAFLFRINAHLPLLESLDVSECEWMEPAVLLPLSKLAYLSDLSVQRCNKMTEFVAYASLTARYGFKSLKSLDLRGSPVGDSEVSAAGWLPRLERLWLCASSPPTAPHTHTHYVDDVCVAHTQLHPWEEKESPVFGETPENVYYDYDDENINEAITENEAVKRRHVDGIENSDGSSANKRHKFGDDDANNDGAAAVHDSGTGGENSELNDKLGTPSTSSHQTSKDVNKSNNEQMVKGKDNETADGDMRTDNKNGEGSSKQNDGHPDLPGDDSDVNRVKFGGSFDNAGVMKCQNGELVVFASLDLGGIKPQQSDGHVRFRRGENPVLIPSEDKMTDKEGTEEKDKGNGDKKIDSSSFDVNAGASTSRQEDTDPPSNDEDERINEPIDYRIEARHHVLYVNVGPQVSTYRFPREFSAPEFPGMRAMQTRHVDSSSLVTDFAIRRFGRADGEDVNVIHIGPNGPVVFGQDMASRPDRSNLRFLSVNGYRNVTDRSLLHLATAAPNLTHVDFSNTNVSLVGARTFRNMRPDCELVHSKFKEGGE